MKKKIGGNTTVELQIRETTRNEIGEQVSTWQTVDSLVGFLDLISSDAKYSTYQTKIEESTHVFITDYHKLTPNVKTQNSSLFEPQTGKRYDIKDIDNPMGLNYQLEFYLKYVGE